MNQIEIEELEQKVKESRETLEKSLKENHRMVDDSFYRVRSNKIDNLKHYLVSISIVCATIIPFSSLVFQIPQSKLPTNITFWLLSVFAFILSLGLFIYSFLRLIDAESKHYVKILLEFLNSSSIDFLSLHGDDSEDKLNQLIKILNAQEKFNREVKSPYEEKDFFNLIRHIKVGSYIFITGLALFFLSIVYIKLISLFCFH